MTAEHSAHTCVWSERDGLVTKNGGGRQNFLHTAMSRSFADRMGLRALSVGSLVGAVVASTPATAWASPSARLVYVRNADTDSCPDEKAVRAAVTARLGYDPFFPNASETMFIEISKEKGGFRARVKLVDEKNNVRGTREIAEKGRSCGTMVDTLALSISIAIDPDSLTRPPAPQATEHETSDPMAPPTPAAPVPGPRPAVSPVIATSPPPPESPPARPPSEAGSHLALLALPAVWVGTGPPVAFGGEIGARLRWSRVSIGVEARGDLPGSRVVKGVDVDMAFFGGTLVGCGHASLFFACARTTLGSVLATSNAAKPRDASTLRVLVGASLGAEIPLWQGLSLVTRLNGNFAFGRQTIVLDGVNAFELPSFSGGLEVGGLVRF